MNIDNTEYLNERCALVTGASNGIGKAIAKRIGPKLRGICLVGRRIDALMEVKASIESLGGTASVVSQDLAEEGAASRVLDLYFERFSRLDALVNVAGVNMLAPVDRALVAEWRQMIEVNLFSLVELVRLSIPHLQQAAVEAGIADVLNISSVNASNAISGTPIYGATKAAIDSFTESARIDLEKSGIRFSTMRPGFTHSDLVANTRTDVLTSMASTFNPGAALDPAVIGEWCEYMLSAPPGVLVREISLFPMSGNG